jgi:hypothetical protein
MQGTMPGPASHLYRLRDSVQEARPLFCQENSDVLECAPEDRFNATSMSRVAVAATTQTLRPPSSNRFSA